MQPKVSMVVPCYNKVQWIGAMFDSVLAQQWDNIELILVNDGSTDGTREIIADYEPKFRTRGYEVVIIDQENQGRAAAVKHGLLRVTGEYVCMPDCDDVLHPEYVSAMAELLIKYESHDCVLCDFQSAPFDFESLSCLKREVTDESSASEYPYRLTESFLLGRIGGSVCKGVFKTESLKLSKAIECFITSPTITQEYQIWIPLALRGAKILACHRTLYYYNTPSIHDGSRDYFLTVESMLTFLEKKNEILKKTLKIHTSHTDDYMKLKAIHSYSAIRSLLHKKHSVTEERYLSEMLCGINETGQLNRIINLDEVERAGGAVLLRYFTNAVIGYPLGRVKISHKTGKGRLIAYAAFGTAAWSVRRGLLNSDICPDIFWDVAAKPADQIEGIPVIAPDFKNLSRDDTVLVLLKDAPIARSVKQSIAQTDAKDNVWFFFDVLDYLADYYFGGNV